MSDEANESSNSAYFASIDVGTNSVLLTIARGIELRVVKQRATVTRLGQDVDRTGVLHPAAQERTLDCLRNYRTLMDEFSLTGARAVGTSACRDAEGGTQFVQRASEVLGFPLEVISGADEAALTFSGALHGLSLSGETFVFDIGGGSTETIIADANTAQIEFAHSFDIGSVRLSERLQLSDPPSPRQVAELRHAIDETLSSIPPLKTRALNVVGVAGTVTTLAAIWQEMGNYDPARIHGSRLPVSELRKWADRIVGMSVAERLTLPGLARGRADVIGAGAQLCAALVELTSSSHLIVSDRGVRFGLLRDLAAAHFDCPAEPQ